jgi:hypothetical protein
MSRLAIVYARNRDFIVQPNSKTTAGFYIGTEPIELLPSDVSDGDLGAAIRRALNASQTGIAVPTNRKADLEPLFQLARIRNWNELQKTATMCEIESAGNEFRITPSSNGGAIGPNKGYHSLIHQTISLPFTCTDQDLSAAVRQAIEHCT